MYDINHRKSVEDIKYDLVDGDMPYIMDGDVECLHVEKSIHDL
jgi:hypothetical protein